MYFSIGIVRIFEKLRRKTLTYYGTRYSATKYKYRVGYALAPLWHDLPPELSPPPGKERRVEHVIQYSNGRGKCRFLEEIVYRTVPVD